jgi:uncharacterized protein (TIGR03435 family)
MRTVVVVVVAWALAFGVPRAQVVERFEVASIRRNESGTAVGGGLAGVQPGGVFMARGVTLQRLIGAAYGATQIVGGPAWIDRDRFDVEARAGGAATLADVQSRLRTLLVERFQVVVHTETRELPVFALIVDRPDRGPGPKLRESDARCRDEARAFVPGAPPGPVPACGDFRKSARTVTARGMTMAQLAGMLTNDVGRPVLDRTNLDSAYDLELEWSSDLGLRQAPPGSAGADRLTPDGLSLFTALQEQLGLRLESTRGPVTVLVVDRAEAPAPN